MNGQSPNLLHDKLEQLRALMPEVFSEGKLDVEKLRQHIGEDISPAGERYTLSWAGKSDALRVLQVPTTATLQPMPQNSVNFDTTQNIFIEGENLAVLKALQKSYHAKVKVIIIDPPYNTGSDSFIYPDRFAENKKDYQKRAGETDEEGNLIKEGQFRKNSKENGQYHSNWLSMMYPRLFLAKNLLKDDGVIFVHIDDNEVHNLRLLMNEIFGEENFVAQVVWQKKTGGGAKTKGFITLHEYVLCYAKHVNENWDIEVPYSEKTRAMYNKKDEHFEKFGPYATWPLDTTSMDERKNLMYPIIHNGQEIWPKKQWLWSKEKVEKAQKENKLVFNLNKEENAYSIRFKGYLFGEDGSERKGKPLSVSIGPYTQEGTKDFENVFDERDIFPFPKPIQFVKKTIDVFLGGKSTNGEIILDFFGGSGTTAQAALELNKEDGGHRKFILVQLPEPCDVKSEAYKAGYSTIADISQERIRRVIKKIEKEREGKLDLDESKLDLGFKSFKLTATNFKVWRGDEIENEEDLLKQLDAFVDPVRPGAENENMLYELMLKSGYALTSDVVEMENAKGNYAVDSGSLYICLGSISQQQIDQIIAARPQKVIVLDRLFGGIDQLKTNTVLQMRDAEIDFKTV